ncbi:MAG: type II toxin-antitoxin system RelE/ParE family toxin [Nitrospirae bacterium]|nr:type II toxin-antitoxin system RelE/ParE family toxin [Nitrospirota bacterium]
MRLFGTKWFMRYARRENIDGNSLHDAIHRAERGLLDADLGGGIIKQRVARTGQGRSGGFRVLVAYRSGDRAVFLYGFSKSERDNIEEAELETLREIGAAWLAAEERQIAHAIKEGIL